MGVGEDMGDQGLSLGNGKAEEVVRDFYSEDGKNRGKCDGEGSAK